ncbi:hypothetical protein H2201_004332 [Coniosporium apollinis]|uniref:CAP-Gly domain-containing protein n=1 Tax=Coniosporium apollinis TaxID=61459 RepID=A0ABQ9NT97_9PEZI|nr:hypothetical protein H2201_004332 [Coniosporium apollinis]
MQALKAGQAVELSDGRSATVRFVGVTAFAAGEWIGVEFAEPLGKNDGSVQNQRYFSCQPNHGMFLRRSAVARVVEPDAPAPRPVATGQGRPRHSLAVPSARQSLLTRPTKPSSTPLSPPPSASTELEQLQAKLRVMEKQRLEDKENLKLLEQTQQERNKFEQVIHKLQAKMQPQAQELVELRRQLKEAQASLEETEAHQADYETAVESATMDREMAEQKAETYKAELDSFKLRLEELEVENELLKEENLELSHEMTDEERSGQGWIQKERENERLKEALLRLRDVSQDQEATLKSHIKSLEEDVQELTTIKQELGDTKAKLLEREADILDVRQQLDNALSAEDIIEELTERNTSLNEQVVQLQNTIDDLKALKELEDELEANHLENAKQLQDVINHKDTIIIDHNRRLAQQEELLADQESTIQRFQGLVSSLQSALADMRVSKEITDTQAEELSTRSRAMLDLNKQLQTSATSTKSRTIDMELRKLDAQEATEHLAIVQLYLPESFHTERDSVLALLRFRRITFKANLLHGLVKDNVSEDKLDARGEHVFTACGVLDQLTWISAMSERFSNTITTSSLEQFTRFEGALYELEPVERALNSYIDRVRRDELREEEITEELQRSISLMKHLAEVHLRAGLDSYADTFIMKTLLMQSQMENTTAALTLVKAEVERNLPTADEYHTDLPRFIQKMNQLITQSRSAKIMVGKTVHVLQELKARSLVLTAETLPAFVECQHSTAELATYTRMLGSNISNVLRDESDMDFPTVKTILPAIASTTSTVFDTEETTPLMTLTIKLRNLSDRLNELYNTSSDLTQTTEFERPSPPWVLHSKEIARSKLDSADKDEEIARLTESCNKAIAALNHYDGRLEEARVKIEVLESRNRDAMKQATRIQELETLVVAAQAGENEAIETLREQDLAMVKLQCEKAKWQDLAAVALEKSNDKGRADPQGQPQAPLATAKELNGLRADIQALEHAVRYVRDENRKRRERKRKAQAEKIAEFQRNLAAARSAKLGAARAAKREAKREELFQAIRKQMKEPRPPMKQVATLPSATDSVAVPTAPKWTPAEDMPQHSLTVQEQLEERELQELEEFSVIELGEVFEPITPAEFEEIRRRAEVEALDGLQLSGEEVIELPVDEEGEEEDVYDGEQEICFEDMEDVGASFESMDVFGLESYRAMELEHWRSL